MMLDSPSLIDARRTKLKTKKNNDPIEHVVGNRALNVLFLCLIDQLGNDIAIWWGNVCVIVLDGVCDFKPKFLIKTDGIFIVRLHMQVYLTNVLLRAKIKDMIQQFCTNT